MILIINSLRKTSLSLFIVAAFFCSINAQVQPPDFVREAVGSVERMLNSDNDEAILLFINQSMVDSSDRDQSSLFERLKEIRKEMRGLRDDIAVEREQDGLRVIMSDGRVEKQLRIVLDFEDQSISDIFLLEAPDVIDLTIDNLSETFDQLEKEGMSGVIYVKIKDEVILKRAFGLANKDLGFYNQPNTIFGTGSRPIDYTVAAIYLLDQQGHLNLDDSIIKYFKQVPEDKVAITIRHLLTGQSGMPDFFHTNEDWDPDLAWVDREPAIKRLLSQELLFKPGTDHAHSHAAFGLLAALIEIITDQAYLIFSMKTSLYLPE
jgi:hypothetical protein